jgi:hypothetical protein
MEWLTTELRRVQESGRVTHQGWIRLPEWGNNTCSNMGCSATLAGRVAWLAERAPRFARKTALLLVPALPTSNLWFQQFIQTPTKHQYTHASGNFEGLIDLWV